MPDIRLVRIDNRLIHGQVAITWTGTVKANIIVVVDDVVATDTMQQNLLKMSTPPGVAVRFFSVDKTIEIINKAKPEQHILLLARTPLALARLVEGGIELESIIVANMHEGDGKKLLIEQHAIYVDQAELDAFKYLASKNVQINAQMIPTTAKDNLIPFIEKLTF